MLKTVTWQKSLILFCIAVMALTSQNLFAAEDLPWGQSQPPKVITPQNAPVLVEPQTNNQNYDPYSNDARNQNESGGEYYAPGSGRSQPRAQAPYGNNAQYDQRQNAPYGNSDPYARSGPQAQPYQQPGPQARPDARQRQRGYSSEEIADAGRSFFGSISGGLASAIEYAFQKQGRPNGYILGEEAGGAFVAGLRYGEGQLFTRDAGRHKVYWQGPSLGYDFGAEGSKTMILVYNLNYPEQIYKRFTGIDGSAYLVGGVGITFQKRDNVILAPIRAGVGVRLGANVGYLKYTRYPTWNPF